MLKFDKNFLSIIYAPIIPIVLFLSVWWISVPFVDDRHIFIWAVAGVVLGILIDLMIYRHWLAVNYRQHPVVMLIISLFYSIGMFGFFMGVPVFNVILGAFAGVYAARKSMIDRMDASCTKLAINRTAAATTAVLGLVCIASAYFALSDPYTSANIGGMLGLVNDPSRLTLWLIIIVGGLLLLIVQYLIVLSSALWTLRRNIE